jgi:hypothetical protein
VRLHDQHLRSKCAPTAANADVCFELVRALAVGTGHSWDVKREQSRIRIGPYVDRLMAVFEASANYADAEVQPKRRRVILYSVGEPTPAVAAIITRAPDVLEVVWRPAPYTCVELRSEVERLMDSFPQLLMGEPQDGGAGLEFGTLDRELVDADDPQVMLATRYPVTLVYAEPVAL